MTLLYSLFELIIAIKISSLTILSDSFHNLGDVGAVLIAMIAVLQSQKHDNEKRSKMIKNIGALLNAASLMSLSFYVLLEAIPRLFYPQKIEDSVWFIVVAIAGIVVNLIGTILFAVSGNKGHHHHSHDENHHEDEGEDLNMKAVCLHYLGDAISSAFVLATGILMFFFKASDWIAYLDPISSFIIIAFIIYTTIPIIRESIKSLLNNSQTLSEIEKAKIYKKIEIFKEINSVLNMKIYEIKEGMILILNISISKK